MGAKLCAREGTRIKNKGEFVASTTKLSQKWRISLETYNKWLR